MTGGEATAWRASVVSALQPELVGSDATHAAASTLFEAVPHDHPPMRRSRAPLDGAQVVLPSALARLPGWSHGELCALSDGRSGAILVGWLGTVGADLAESAVADVGGEGAIGALCLMDAGGGCTCSAEAIALTPEHRGCLVAASAWRLVPPCHVEMDGPVHVLAPPAARSPHSAAGLVGEPAAAGGARSSARGAELAPHRSLSLAEALSRLDRGAIDRPRRIHVRAKVDHGGSRRISADLGGSGYTA